MALKGGLFFFLGKSILKVLNTDRNNPIERKAILMMQKI